MNELCYDIRPIAMDEWLPDGCIAHGSPIDPATDKPGSGCDSLQPYTRGGRDRLVAMYRRVLGDVGCCGFVAWVGGRIVGYNNFFPGDWARKIRFYGWGQEQDIPPRTLVHNCVSVKVDPLYRRKGIGTDLIRHSLDWGRTNGWRRFEVHLVTPDSPEHFAGEQKSCVTFWQRLGFEGFRQDPDGTCSMAIDLRRYEQ